MMANMTGSSILKSTDHTSQVKLGNLSDRIIPDGEQNKGDFSDSESEVTEADSEDEWESCVSSVEEDECFYDVVTLDHSQDASYYSVPIRSLNSNFETNLSGLAMNCKQPSKSDQGPNLIEKAYLTQKSHVPELNETDLVEGMKQVKNNDNHLRMLSNMMEKETHVDSVSSGEPTDICQILFDIEVLFDQKYTGDLKEPSLACHKVTSGG